MSVAKKKEKHRSVVALLSIWGALMFLPLGANAAYARWLPVGTNINARSATLGGFYGDDLWVLDQDDHVAGQGYAIKYASDIRRGGALGLYGGRGTSITSGVNHVYTIGEDEKVWRKKWSYPPADPNWYYFPRTLCAGGNIRLYDTKFRHNIAVVFDRAASSDRVYVIGQGKTADGATSDYNRRAHIWAGNCWSAMLPLPGASKEIYDIAPNPHDATKIWATNSNDEIFEWGNVAWVKITSGTSFSLGNDMVVGSDGVRLWYYNSATRTFSKDTYWPSSISVGHVAHKVAGNAVGGMPTFSNVVIGTDGTLYYSMP